MALKQSLTNEMIRKAFPNNFDLAAYAISLARYYIKSGHEMTLDEVLDEIRRHPNPSYLKDLQEADLAEKLEVAENE